MSRYGWLTGLVALTVVFSGCEDSSEPVDQLGAVSQAAMSDHLLMTFEGTEVGVPATPKSGTMFDVDWDNDGVFDEFGFSGEATHTFADAGPHTVRVDGQLERLRFQSKPYRENLVSVDQWGSSEWSSFESAFSGCTNLKTVTADPPDLSGVAFLDSVFRGASSFEGDVSQWNVGFVVSMREMFQEARSFNGDVSGWNVENVEDMSWMFERASAFNGDLSGWDVGAVRKMESMFSQAVAFNSDLSQWRVENVTRMNSMFNYALAFNGDISDWNTGQVEDMSSMFLEAYGFNSDLSQWDVRNVQKMTFMFGIATSFNSDISGWQVDSLTDASLMFSYATAFDQNLGGWDISGISNMGRMLERSNLSTENYDATLSGWASLSTVPEDITLGGLGLTYCAATQARQSLIDDHNWTITGDVNVCCGNGAVDAGEVCDDGVNDGTDGSCASDCGAFITACYPDADDDGFGSMSTGATPQSNATANTCTGLTSLDNTDCNDNPSSCGADCFPNNPAADVCDGFNQDCDANTDEDFAPNATACGVGACAATGTEVCQAGVVVEACTPGQAAGNDATCDGVDNDCNGETDEDYVSVVTSCGVGACAAAGATSCASGGVVVDSCSAGSPASNDATCNGIDDDCNGQVDEDYVSMATTCGQGACSASGMMVCSGGAEQNTCAPGQAAATDATCDGVDDDCDGATDEDYASISTSCGVGACGDTGATSCVDGVVNDSCTAGTPAGDDATCDGVDDDCDGVTDEDYASSTTACGVGACVANGTLSCSSGVEIDSCTPDSPATDDATCDGVDDDCDGEADDDYVQTSTSCGTGACGGSGTLSCQNGVEVDSCSTGSGDPTDESCDGVDDDCNGEQDEDYVTSTTTCGVGACRSTGTLICSAGSEINSCTPGSPASDDATCDGIDDDCDGQIDEDYAQTSTSCGTGLCAASGSLSCVNGTEVDSCSPNPGAVTDVTCDGVDDDCDGQTDEDYAQISTSCGIGSCLATGVLSCESGTEVDSCSAGTPSASDATCDGVDDDCDGQTDEDYMSTNTTCGQGACAATGRLTCIDGAETDSCAPGQAAVADATCDGVDDDCDGQTDEDYASTPTSCGVGACADSGLLRCVGGAETDSCTPAAPASNDATCDGVDDDCDGTRDEDFAESSSSCGLGVCAASGAITCVGGAERNSCSPGTPANSDSVCDGRDEDCDGDIDEDATSCFACDDVSDCPTLTNECRSYACVDEVCEIGDVSAGAACDDDSFCTMTDACDGAGSCVGAGQPCTLGAAACDDVGDFCNECLVATDCADDGNDCTETRCTVSVAAANNCAYPNLDAGIACPDDGAFCTGGETCDGSGACVSSGDPCTNGVACNEAADSCALPCGDGIVASGEVCDDGAANGAVGSCSALCDGYVVACFVDADEDGFSGETSVEVVAAAADSDCTTLTGSGGEVLVAENDDCDDDEADCTTDCSDVDDDGIADCVDGCIDADGDNFGFGAGCTGADCDDDDASCFADCSVRVPGFGCVDAQICAKELPGADSDNDGLPDFYEDILCVETNNAFTDTDTLNDFVELCDFGTNPCSSDTDNDGFDDDVEIDAGSNPLDARSTPESGGTPSAEASGGSGAGGCAVSGSQESDPPMGVMFLLVLGLLSVSRRRLFNR